MIPVLKRELVIIIVLLVALTLLLHPDMLNHPVARLELMHNRANYAHPLLYTLVIYGVVGVIRGMAAVVMRFRNKG
ncbi:MAG: hypothetical protein DSZ03_04865 [Sulfurimonas sp.]|nr:MAG: hypothetical protein DSZ03_04865 [Sulfurimonas sp.]